MKTIFKSLLAITALSVMFASCGNGESNKKGALSSSAAEKVYVAPGEHDEFYAFISGGFSGQLSVYGLPSGRLFKVIPVFSVDGEKAYGFNEETKAMLNTSFGQIPWGDSHHPDISQTAGELDGRYVFINENNTPRVAKVDLTTFETTEIIEVPNSAGNHSSSYVTENTEYVIAGTRFGIPIPQRDMPISEYKGNFKGTLSFISVDPKDGNMDIAFQILMPGFDYDKAHPGRGDSHGWFFYTTYNTEEANSLLEVNASQNDKDFIAAINWKKIEEYVNNGGGTNAKVISAYWNTATTNGINIQTNLTTQSGVGNGYGVSITNLFNADYTTGAYSELAIGTPYVPTSGTGTYTNLRIGASINQTGGANGITRGLYVSPTLTAAADWRSIETSTGKVLFNKDNSGNIQADYSLNLKGNNPRLRLEAGTGGTTNADAVIQFADSAGDNWIIKRDNSTLGLILGYGWNNSLQQVLTLGIRSSDPTAVVRAAVSSTVDVFLAKNFSGTDLFSIRNTGNILVNTTTDAGFRLDVNGTARVGGPSAGATMYLKGLSGGGQYLYFDNGGEVWTMLGSTVFVMDSTAGRLLRISRLGQVTINGNANDATAQLQVDSTTRGFLPPRMTTTQKNAIGTPAAGLMVFDTTLAKLCVYSGTAWETITSI